MGIGLPEILRPGVHMGVEVDERARAAAFGQRPQQRQRDAVIAAERDQVRDRTGLLLDPRQAAEEIAERDGEIADVGHRQGGGIDPVLRMRPIGQHSARLPDRRRPEAGAAAIGGAEIERNAGDADRRVAVVARDPEEARRDRVGGRDHHVASAGGSVNRNTAEATAQVHTPAGAPSVAAVIERLSTMRSLIS